MGGGQLQKRGKGNSLGWRATSDYVWFSENFRENVKKKIERKSIMKEKIKKNKKINLNLIKYFYMFFKFILLISLNFNKIK